MNLATNETIALVTTPLTSLVGKVSFKCGSVIQAGKFFVKFELKPKVSQICSKTFFWEAREIGNIVKLAF